MTVFKTIASVSFLSTLLLCACQNPAENPEPPPSPQNTYVYSPPIDHNDGWNVASIQDFGIKESNLTALMNKIIKGSYNEVDSILIVKRGILVFEEYQPGHDFNNTPVNYDWNVRHHNASVSKSIVSALVGIAMDLKLLEDVHTTIKPFFAEYTDIDWGNGKDLITIENLLAMTSGLYFDESSTALGSASNSHYLMNNSADPIKYVLEQPMMTPPGTAWNYSSGNTNLLGRIIKKSCGMYVDEFAQHHLFNHLGISDYTWNKYDTGDIRAHGGLGIRPRDMAKFGQLYLNGGVWNGQQVISQDWIQDSISNQIPEGDYGYSWWLYTFQLPSRQIESFRAVGWGGQLIVCFPSLECVVVITGGNYNKQDFSMDIVQTHVLPALVQ